MEKLISLDTGLIFWTWATFLIVLVVLGAKAWKPMIEALERRQQGIDEALAMAQKAREETAALTSRFEEQLQTSRQEAQQVLADARAVGEKLRSEIEADAHRNAVGILAKAREQIEAEKQKALEEVRTSVVDLSIAIASKVLERNISTGDNKKLAEESMRQIGEA